MTNDTGAIELAVIGGTGLYQLADLRDVESHQPVTRYGAPSGPVARDVEHEPAPLRSG